MTAARWFAGEGRDAEHEAFLAQLRTRAEHEGLVDVAERDTRVLISSSGYSELVVGVRPPGFPATGPAPVLQVGYTDDDGRLYLLGGWETFGVVLDPPTHYEAADPVATPADLADSVGSSPIRRRSSAGSDAVAYRSGYARFAGALCGCLPASSGGPREL